LILSVHPYMIFAKQSTSTYIIMKKDQFEEIKSQKVIIEWTAAIKTQPNSNNLSHD